MEIQAERQMAAAVFIGDKFALETREESMRRLAAVLKGKPDGFAFRNLADAGDFYFCHAGNLYKWVTGATLFARRRVGRGIPTRRNNHLNRAKSPRSYPARWDCEP